MKVWFWINLTHSALLLLLTAVTMKHMIWISDLHGFAFGLLP